MKKPTILLIGTQDTKASELAIIRQHIEKNDCEVLHMDPSIRKYVAGAEITPDMIAEAGGHTIEEVRSTGHEGKSLGMMIEGAIAVAKQALAEDRYCAVIGIGGTMGTALVSAVMRELPYGLPKVIISTMASGFTAPFVGFKDIAMFNAVTDVAGVNRINRNVYRNAAYAIAAMAAGHSSEEPERKPLILMGTLGATEQGTKKVREDLEKEGFEVMVFHTVGRGGPAMDAIATNPDVVAVLELSWIETTDQIFGGLAAGGPDRCKAALQRGVPTIFAPGTVDFMLGGDYEDTLQRFPGRIYHRHNPAITAVRTTLDDLKLIGDHMADLAKNSNGPVSFVMPLGGYSYHDCPEGNLYDPTLPKPFAEYMRKVLPAEIPVIEVDSHINEAPFADAVVAETLRLIGKRHSATVGGSAANG